MSEPLSPQQILETLILGIAAQAWHGLDHLYAEDAVVEHPFALPAPTPIEGRRGDPARTLRISPSRR